MLICNNSIITNPFCFVLFCLFRSPTPSRFHQRAALNSSTNALVDDIESTMDYQPDESRDIARPLFPHQQQQQHQHAHSHSHSHFLSEGRASGGGGSGRGGESAKAIAGGVVVGVGGGMNDSTIDDDGDDDMMESLTKVKIMEPGTWIFLAEFSFGIFLRIFLLTFLLCEFSLFVCV